MENPDRNKAITTGQNTKYSCKIQAVLECAQQNRKKNSVFCLLALVFAIKALKCILIKKKIRLLIKLINQKKP